MLRRNVFPALLALALLPTIAGISAAEAGERALSLIMFREPACPWCEAWDNDIGESYHLTEEGRTAPVRHIDMTENRPEDLAHIKGIRYSPTFVLIEKGGREIGRITGYPGEDFFWPLLNDLLKQSVREEENNESS